MEQHKAAKLREPLDRKNALRFLESALKEARRATKDMSPDEISLLAGALERLSVSTFRRGGDYLTDFEKVGLALALAGYRKIRFPFDPAEAAAIRLLRGKTTRTIDGVLGELHIILKGK